LTRSGKAFPQCQFLRWAPVPGNPYGAAGSADGGRAAATVAEMRAHKGLPGAIPTAAELGDRL
jgi:hypothetical protein